MTHILLITDTERIQRVFESLEKDGFLQLQAAATLDQSEQEIAASIPDVTFVQSRISGFSGQIVLRHLKKNLPEGAKIIVLAGDAEEMAQAHKHADAEPFLDLTADDEALVAAIKAVLNGTYLPAPKKVAAERTPEVAAERTSEVAPPSRTTEVAPPARTTEVAAEQVAPASKSEHRVADGVVGFVPVPLAVPMEPDTAKATEANAGAGPADLPQLDNGNAGAEPFAEIMRRASLKGVSSASVPADLEERVTLGKPLSEMIDETSKDRSDAEEAVGPVTVEDFTSGEPLADAIRRAQKKKRPLWVYALTLAVLSIPVFAYIAGKTMSPPESSLTPTTGSRTATISKQSPLPTPQIAPPIASTPAPVKPAATAKLPPSATSPAPATAPRKVPVPAAAPAPSVATAQGAKSVAPSVKSVPVPVAQPAAKRGWKALPPVVTQAKLDPSYGKTNPGWQRYVGAGVEYKLFREAELYKAVKVIALNGDAIPGPLLKRVLLEFSGVDTYLVKSTGEKGDYLVEQGVTKSGLALTAYRKKGDHRVKAFVLYHP